MINSACVKFRLSAGLRQLDIVPPEEIKNLSAFENGRSSNIKYLTYYYHAAIKQGLVSQLESFIRDSVEQ